MNTSLLSPGFLGIALAAILLLPVLGGAARQLAFLALNLAFIAGVVLEPVGVVGTLLFTAAGYLLVQVAARGGRRPFIVGIALFVALFVYMQRYDFLVWLVGEELLTRALATVGLSFLFFKILHVAIDAHGGTIGALDPLTYLNYCLSFTTFLMGPIQRYQDYRAQWRGEVPSIAPSFEAQVDAVLRVLVGLVKAYVLGPIFEAHALRPDTHVLELSPIGLIVQSYAFWIFLYLNFSGYCDVVIGVGSLMGVRPPENFNKPFLARNISDFWLRQHRSLTLWLTDYVFTPTYKSLLGAPWTARHKLLALNVSLMVTMMVSGLWHGTTLAFFLFGLVHGLWFVIYVSWDRLLTARLGRKGVQRFRAHPLVHAGGILLTFNATAFTFIFFRVRSDRILRALTEVL